MIKEKKERMSMHLYQHLYVILYPLNTENVESLYIFFLVNSNT